MNCWSGAAANWIEKSTIFFHQNGLDDPTLMISCVARSGIIAGTALQAPLVLVWYYTMQAHGPDSLKLSRVTYGCFTVNLHQFSDSFEFIMISIQPRPHVLPTLQPATSPIRRTKRTPCAPKATGVTPWQRQDLQRDCGAGGAPAAVLLCGHVDQCTRGWEY